MNTPLPLTEDGLQDLLLTRANVVLDFHAAWCAPCRGFAPVYAAAAPRFPALAFRTVDVDAEPDLAAAFGVRSVPTLLVIRERILVARHAGATDAAGLQSLLEQSMLVDMDDLRAELAAAEGDADAIDH